MIDLHRRIVFALALCFWGTPAIAQGPTVLITSATAGATADVDYTITNTSVRNIYVFSPFLGDPFDGELNPVDASDVLWTSFTPAFRGNYFTKLEFVTIAAGQSYKGHLSSAFAAEQLNNCTKSLHLSLRLTVGWGFDTDRAKDEWKKDNFETIRIVQRWQTLAMSQKYTFERTQPQDPKRCPAHQPVEIWR